MTTINRPGAVLNRSSVVVEPAQSRRLVLGSASPRRSALLTTLGVDFIQDTVDLDEQALVGEHDSAATSVAHIARAKFAAFGVGGKGSPQMLLTADTLVACNGTVMGKPESADHLHRMLGEMAGHTLAIVTAVCLGERGQQPPPAVVTTNVTLRALTAPEIAHYVATGAGMDKAGGLALQSEANNFIQSVHGCWSNVLGLPLCVVAAALDLVPKGVDRVDRCSVSLCGAA